MSKAPFSLSMMSNRYFGPGGRRRIRIIAYPRKGIPYTECFYAAIDGRRAEVVDGIWSGRWIIEHIRAGDVVHFHWPSFYYSSRNRFFGRAVPLLRFVILLLIIRVCGAQIVWTAHNLYPHDGGRADRVHRFVRWLITRLATLVLVHGDSSARIVSAEFGVQDARICRIQHCNFIGYYPSSRARGEARERIGIDENRFVFGLVGLCKPYKNLEALIDAFVSLKSDAALMIAGAFQSQAYLARIESKIKALPRDKIILHRGFIPPNEIQLYMQALDVMVLPYTEILASGSAILALSFAKPVIAPDLGSVKEVVAPSCGILYNPREPGALPEAMRRAMSIRFDTRAIVNHVSNLDWSDSATRFLERLALKQRASPGRGRVNAYHL